ncbi:hypothetical protein METBIDRAFT_42155 [Metschnikowia bicuspidata var. bicuspidata NRRL YB-4993]|uniref:S-adenosyl-L-methionine-dependent methyltransferase n=1 Tax=Metschnikowia bicuspidata var. bicuspidata NRRL YB-4993 TaxID=869754 RepID=A0A1A0HB02_9ASCO|nr:hypothetical protein METBIDRAFT_42155 [Metschnikowia bicuspidata var. bicuspidata NRRL YB-4993]OBA21062.1 hypothetical protein METBIDRAFT_42155 [Metschnikowia bicuspidata var. bicuspidata NRRL YB-4993]
MAHDISAILDEQSQENVARDLAVIAQSNCFYVKLFLALYVRVLEQRSAVIDALYELYCEPRILSARELPPTAADTLQYSVDAGGETVAIRETPRVISGAGTTGLRTWEAALYMLNYLNNSASFSLISRGKRILELGTGTGLVLLALLKKHSQHQFASIALTDGDSALLENLPATFALNGLPPRVPVNVSQLIWGEELLYSEASGGPGRAPADIVVAADVTYDSLVVPSLCDTMAQFFQAGASVAYVAATIRNTATIEVWEAELDRRFSWTICDAVADPHGSELTCWFRRGTPEIRVYEIRGGRASGV